MAETEIRDRCAANARRTQDVRRDSTGAFELSSTALVPVLRPVLATIVKIDPTVLEVVDLSGRLAGYSQACRRFVDTLRAAARPTNDDDEWDWD